MTTWQPGRLSEWYPDAGRRRAAETGKCWTDQKPDSGSWSRHRRTKGPGSDEESRTTHPSARRDHDGLRFISENAKRPDRREGACGGLQRWPDFLPFALPTGDPGGRRGEHLQLAAASTGTRSGCACFGSRPEPQTVGLGAGPRDDRKRGNFAAIIPDHKRGRDVGGASDASAGGRTVGAMREDRRSISDCPARLSAAPETPVKTSEYETRPTILQGAGQCYSCYASWTGRCQT